ncbi:FAD-dependent oxidoreductase [Arthrobacter psychrolactophilus]|uniref:FAD-dependent oxidoreductase n=1 Tax=Arthrobacter psychrolactophilus TaxID=92442 RepID=A0A2V5IQ63_9MICC|nr:FAD-dependent oxidoreductase [Arthrobacter psychrolactophilus]PYI38718.1 FAD-dependent oxidoreductase [Arthrobacter psychrolactophilus]
MNSHVDVIVVGGGAMGSAAALSVTRKGKSVLLFEQFSDGHSLGASHGASRNFNTAYQEPEYLTLVSEARLLWDELAQETGVQLLDLVGLVNHGNLAALKRVRAMHEQYGIESSFLSAEEAMSRWPGMHFRGEALFVPNAGRVRAADALMALRQAAEARGAQFHYDHPVRSIDVLNDELVQVVTDEGSYTASRVIVTAGAWTKKLLGEQIDIPQLVVTQEQPAHFHAVDASMEWPSFNHSPDPAERADDYWYSHTYGMLTPGEGIKIGWHGVGAVVDPDARDFAPEPTQMAALRRYAREWFPGLDADTFVPISCTYTSTTTGDFVLDRCGPLVVGAGFSGHGFKFTPAIGRILADLCEGIHAPEIFRAHRAL